MHFIPKQLSNYLFVL